MSARRGSILPFVSTLSVALLIGIAFPLTASATAPCYNTITNVEGSDSAQDGNHQGIQTSMHIGSYSGDCIRVSSIGVVNGDGQVEMGYLLGYHPSNGNVYTGGGACVDSDYFSTPEIFVVWIPIGGSYHCKNLKSESESQFQTFSTSDANQDTRWQVSEGGSQLFVVNMNFDRGTALTNGERHNLTTDIAQAHFTSLKKQVSGNGSTWFDFTSSYKYFDNDPDFKWVFDSNTNTEVSHI